MQSTRIPFRALSSGDLKEKPKNLKNLVDKTPKSPFISLLSQSKSQKNFYSNFRSKANILIRALKEKSSQERTARSQINALENIDRIKSKNDFFSLKCMMKNEFSQVTKPYHKTNVFLTSTNSKKKFLFSRRKHPVSINQYYFDANIVPDCNKKPLTYEDLEAYMKIKSRSSQRFTHSKLKY